MNRRFLLALSGFLLLGAALQAGTARAADAHATIDNFTFSLPILAVSVGTKVARTPWR